MDLVKWIKPKKRRDENDDDDEVRRVGRQYRSHSVDPTSAHYIAAQNMNLAHHAGGINGAATAPGSIPKKSSPPLNQLFPPRSHSRRRLSLSSTSSSNVVDPNAFMTIENETTVVKKRRKSRGMLSLFGSGNETGDGSKSNLFSGRKSSSNYFSPTDVTLVENVAHVTTPTSDSGKKEKTTKTKKKVSRKGLLAMNATNSDVSSKNLKSNESVNKLDSLAPPPRDASRRHSISVVITAPPILQPTTTEAASPTAYVRRRRRSQGIPPPLVDYYEDLMKMRNRISGGMNPENNNTEDSDNTPYIRPPIVIVTSQRRKYSLQYGDDGV